VRERGGDGWLVIAGARFQIPGSNRMRNQRKGARAATGDSPVPEVAEFLYNEAAVPYPIVIEMLGRIDAKFPSLTFREFVTAVRLSDYASRLPWGTA
jgi:hypothetical protein